AYAWGPWSLGEVRQSVRAQRGMGDGGQGWSCASDPFLGWVVVCCSGVSLRRLRRRASQGAQGEAGRRTRSRLPQSEQQVKKSSAEITLSAGAVVLRQPQLGQSKVSCVGRIDIHHSSAGNRETA